MAIFTGGVTLAEDVCVSVSRVTDSNRVRACRESPRCVAAPPSIPAAGRGTGGPRARAE